VKDEEDVSATTNASGSQGVQVGTGNLQYNTWTMKTPLDPASLSALNPHAVLKRLEGMPHDDLVDLFAKATSGDVAEALKTLLEADESKVVAVLADINPRKATELIASVAVSASWLEALSGAAEEIARKAVELKWVYQGSAGHLERYYAGYARRYKNGRIYWHSNYGAHRVSEMIDAYLKTAYSRLGFPVSDEEAAPPSPYGTSGTRQSFATGIVYSSKHGAYSVGNDFLKAYESEGGSAGRLGFPIHFPPDVGLPRRVPRSPEDVFSPTLQRFEGGTIYSTPPGIQEDGFAVHSNVARALSSVWGFYPISKETPAVLSTYGTSGHVQHFMIDRGPVKVRRGSKPRYRGEFAVYTSTEYGAVVILPEVWGCYRDMGPEASWLGFPVEAGRIGPPLRSSVVQAFEGGTIYWRRSRSAIAVPRAFNEVISEDLSRLRERLGFPVTEEWPIDASGINRVQFFETGVATLRNGKRDIWLRP